MNLNFDARQVQPSQPMEPVPEGWYAVVISGEEPKAVKDKPQSWFLSMTMDIIDGPHKGRRLFTNLNLGNDNQQAVEIAQRELSAICHVTGVFVLNEQTGGTAALKGKPFMVKAVVENSRNTIKGYKDMQGNDPGKTGGQAHAPVAPVAPPMAPQAPQQAPQAAPPAWGAPQAAPAPQPQAAPAWGAPAPAAAPAWGAPAAPQPAAAPPAWGGGQPAPMAAPAAAPAPAWAPAPTPAAPAGAPWAR